ncbi:MAG: DEAD/DEAH box helicase family protein [Clostridia bacterium]|nr:DEAD/DEAH box helicase family protein [Clostridia bacterium]
MTLPDDRHYNTRSEALDTVKAYQHGEFSLFGEKREPVVVQDNSASEPDTKEQKPRQPSHKTKPAEKYSLGFGHMGNGLTVWNNLEYEHGDYKIVAHIAADRTVKFYDDEMPESVRKIIIEEAETSDDRVSVTQNDPVFPMPPRERTLRPPAEEVQHQPEQPPVNTDGQAPIQTSAVSEEHTEASSPWASQVPASSPRTIAQEDIDEALREWNGSIESKRAVVAYMREHGREREAAAWLRQECGDDMPAYPVHGVVGAEGDISWTRVQRGILRLIQEDRFFTEEEKWENLSLEAKQETNSEEKEPEISVPSSEAAATPYPAEFVTPGGIHYHVGDTFQYTRPDGSVSSILIESVDEGGYFVLSSDRFSGDERIAVLRSAVEENIDEGKYTPKGGEAAEEAFHTPGGHTYRTGDELDWVVDGDLHISIHIDRVDAENVWCTFPGSEDGEPTRMERNGFEAQIDNGSFTFMVAEQEQTQEEVPASNPEQQETVPAAEQKDTVPLTAEETAVLPISMEAAVEYNDLKARYPDALVGFEQHGYYEFYGEDTKTASLLLNTKIFTKEVPGGHINVTGFPTRQWQHNFRTLWSNGNDVYLASEKPDGTHEETKYLRKEDYIPLNAKLHINGREFRVASVDFQSRKVSLQDMNMKQESNYPLFREVLIAEARNLLEDEMDFPVSLDEITPQNPAKEPEPAEETSSDKREEINPSDGPFLSDNAILPDPEKESSIRHETTAYYPGEKNGLPFDIEIQTLHIDEPDHDPPGKTASPAAENFRITDDHLGEGGAKTKFKNNMAAIYTLKALETEGRPATHDEQEVLSRYVGWGGLSAAFDPDKKDWSGEYEELKAALTTEEYTAARASTLNAHYTSPTVIRAVYEALDNMGFKRGNILEPAMGVGNFFGMLPESMKESKLYGVELDSITGRIAQKLYPRADITVAGFETTDRRDFYDVAVGNVPFGNYKVNDRAYNKLGFNIHNYFFAKALDQVRPGGIVAFVTSRYTMDAKSPEVRKYLAQRAELLGAIRLPNNAFFTNAGTEVTSDIIFLQKRDRPIDIEPDWVHLGMTGDGIPVNSYFADHPEMVLGNITWDKSMYGDERETTCVPLEGVSLADQLSVAIQRLSGQYQEADLPDLAEGEEITDTIRADPNVANYSYTVVDGKVYYRENSIMVRPKLSQTAQERTAGMVELRDCVRQLMSAQLNNASDQAILALQEKLNTLYDAYTAKYGLINSRGNAQAFADDSSYYLLCSLEVLDENGNLERKADMFTKRTIRQQQVVDHVDTAVEALAVSIAERAAVDLPFMARLTGKSEKEITADLQGVIFRLPEPAGEDGRSRYVTADEYLSGNVRQKLRVAQSWAESDEAFNVNVKALEQVQPEDLSASEIDVRLGATWVDPHYIQQFMYETFHTPLFNQRTPDHYVRERYAVTVNFSRNTAEWTITNKRAIPDVDVAAYSTFGTSRAGAYDLLEAALNLRDVKIYDKKYDPDGKEVRVLNPKETTLAQQKQQAIKDAFREWIWKDPERREELVRVYNERFNSTRPREYDGSHISFVGMNPEINLRPHQRNAIAHVLYGGNTLLAHQVGAGKTFEMAASAMESKRLGLCSKSLFVVPNHLTEQWASEFLRLYPSAKILVAKKKDFEKKSRKKFCARIATGEYDAVIIGHSQFEKIPISFMRQERLLEEQIREIMEAIEEVKYERGERFTVKQMERSRKQLEARLEKLRAEHKKDDVVTFEELGVDRLYVDEAHFYKNLFTFTKMSNVAGLSTAEAQKSSDMFLKCRYMDEITGSRGIIFATGTPVSNSMVELYTMQRYLQFDALKEKGMNHFDCWASTFGETVTALELAPEGTGYRARTRFAKFFNLPELMNMFKEVADIKTADLLNLPTPEAHYETTAVQPSEIQERLVKSLSERAAAVHAHIVDPSDDNMLKITSDGRKLGLDQRLIDPMLPDHPGSKVNVCVDNIFRIWQEGKADKLTQLVFCDLSTPRSSASSRSAPVTEKEGKQTEAEKGDTPETEESAASVDEQKKEDIPEPIVQNIDQFSVYDDIRSKLIAKGVPPEEIAFIHDANTEVRKKELFAKVRSGQVRVLMGSTSKMGAGTNCQDRLIALHDLDAPWRPGDLEQRAGRIVRQGNTNKDVYIYRYVTEKSFDAYLWQTLENKQKFISQIMTSKSPVRSCEDVDETALSYAEIKALCAGDPRIKEKMDLDIEVARLRLMKADHDSKKYALEDQIRKEFPKKISQCQQTIEGLRHDLEQLAAHPVPEKEFAGMTVDGTFYSEKSKAGTAIIEFCKKHYTTDRMEIGEYRGFPMTLQYDPFNKRFELTMHGEMSHRTELGSDVYGNIQRIDNALASIGQRIDGIKANLENYQNQMKAAEEEVQKTFPHEEELKEKSAKLAELDAELNIDGQPRPQEQTEIQEVPEREIAKQARPSILERLQQPCACPAAKRNIPAKEVR